MDLSIVAPAYNEKDNIRPFLHELEEVLSKVGKSYEIIVIDDGSNDGTYKELAHLTEKVDGLRVLKLRKNFGQTAALSLGFSKAQGDVVIVMDTCKLILRKERKNDESFDGIHPRSDQLN